MKGAQMEPTRKERMGGWEEIKWFTEDPKRFKLQLESNQGGKGGPVTFSPLYSVHYYFIH